LYIADACGSLIGSEIFGVPAVIDPDGYRPNVGIILMRADGMVFWARRVSRDGWQFPQGGMNTDETPLEAMYRELEEETGLLSHHVEVLGATPGWLRYRLPRRSIRTSTKPVCIGQKQVWFLLKLNVEDTAVKLDGTDSPEFDSFRWVDFWYPGENVVNFKREVYIKALHLLSTKARTLVGEEKVPAHIGEDLIRKLRQNERKPLSGRRTLKNGTVPG
jgi:putative (di)nucleoside polyphosphate hydrolase